MERTCRICKAIKPLDELNYRSSFNKKKQKAYFRTECITCTNDIRKAFRQTLDYLALKEARKRDVERVKVRTKRNPARYKIKAILVAAKYRAKQKNIPCDITEADIILPEYCPALGIKLEFSNPYSSKDSSFSLDRIDPELGYVKGNVAVISQRANQIKSNGTIDEHQKIIDYMKSHLKK